MFAENRPGLANFRPGPFFDTKCTARTGPGRTARADISGTENYTEKVAMAEHESDIKLTGRELFLLREFELLKLDTLPNL